MDKLSKNMIIKADITGYSSDGMGVCRHDGQVVFVKGALCGEACEVRILKVGKSVSYGKVESIITPSEHRVSPVCPSFGKCGGCTLLHMDYDEELSYKKSMVSDALTRIGGVTVPVSAIHGSPENALYRNKVIYNIQRNRDGKIIYGFFRPRTHEVIEGEDCVIGFAEADSICRAVIGWMESSRVEPYDMAAKTGAIRHVFVRRGEKSGEIQVGVISAVRKLKNTDELIKAVIKACDGVKSIVLNVNDTAGNTVLGGEFITIYGDSYITDTLCGLTFKLSLRSFFQVNPAQAEHLYDKAIEFASLTGRETVLDLYCGTGTITLCLARSAGRVYGAEIVPQAIADAKENAEQNGVGNAEFFCADASDAAARFAREGIRPDVITVDPPRKGLSPDVIESIVEMSPARLVYVSCDPATLARDLKLFTQGGCEVKKVECYDMFPRCSHVETVCLLSRN